MQKRGFKFLNKKSQLITRNMIIHLGMIGILFLISFVLFSYVKSIEKDTEFQKIFLSRDLALMMNTLYSAPGNVEYTYSFDKLDLSKFKFEFKSLEDKQVAGVIDESIAKTYPYAKPSQSKEENLVYNANSIKFSKNAAKLTVTKNE